MKHQHDDWSLPEDARKVLKKRFKNLQGKVVLEIFTRGKENNQYDILTEKFGKELEKLSDKIVTHVNTIGDVKSKKYDVTRSPTILINPEKYKIRYTGAPFGEEGKSFIEAIIMTSLGDSGLSKKTKDLLAKLKEKRDVKVFVTLTCPYCPGQVINAFRAAIERSDLISGECVDSSENMDLAEKFNVGAVPHTIINDRTISRGFEPEERFVKELISLEPAKDSAIDENIIDKKETEVDLVIVGAGPAGLTAGIYSSRSGLNSIILEKEVVGGQASITPVVENWPGFASIPGKQLMDMINAQVRSYLPVIEGEEVIEVKIGKKIEAITNKGKYISKALIISTGASHKKLGVVGEDKFYGRGVAYCATCDGYLYKGKKVVVIGGGNTALTDAIYLKSLGANVTLINRGERFRAEKYLQDSVQREKIPVIWDSVIEELSGGKNVERIKIKNVKDNKTKTLKIDGVFVAVGLNPNNNIAVDIGLTLDEYGYIKVDRFGRTNIPRIYGAGDITGGVRQIVTAVGEGATVATSAFEDLSNPYWMPKKK